MDRPRLSIATAIGLIVAIGLGLAALRGSSPTWGLAATLVLLGSLLSATVGAFLLRERGRAFGIGFSVFGWTLLFLLFSSVPSNYLAFDEPGFPPVRDFLSLRSDSSGVSSILYPAFHPVATPAPASSPGGFTGGFPSPAQTLLQKRIDRFRRIFLVELNLLFALVGGLVVRSFAPRPGSPPREGGTREARRDP